jgi:hypothetical protein
MGKRQREEQGEEQRPRIWTCSCGELSGKLLAGQGTAIEKWYRTGGGFGRI